MARLNKLTRMWVNQPSEHQPLHHLHGVNVLAITERDDTVLIYFLSGPVLCQQAPRSALSEGWGVIRCATPVTGRHPQTPEDL
jgi:hypothetical protein